VRVIARGVGNLPTNFGVLGLGTFRSRLGKKRNKMFTRQENGLDAIAANG